MLFIWKITNLKHSGALIPMGFGSDPARTAVDMFYLNKASREGIHFTGKEHDLDFMIEIFIPVTEWTQLLDLLKTLKMWHKTLKNKDF